MVKRIFRAWTEATFGRVHDAKRELYRNDFLRHDDEAGAGIHCWGNS